ncbi:MAG: DUF2835 domain-containing protein [Methylococcaceae bacterium]|nr:DUF2835 domain-containing protein [Methylococcaceae bacterium]
MGQYQSILFTLELSYDDFLKVYQGTAKNISVVADDGRRIMFPARNVQSFLTKNGIKGYFEMTLTAENRFISLKKLR